MGARIYHIFIFLLLPSIVVSQSLNTTTAQGTSDNNPSTFLLEDGEIRIGSDAFQFLANNRSVTQYENFGISPDGSVVAVLKRVEGEAQIDLFNSAGDPLNSYSAKSLGSDDPSLGIFALNNGNVILRDNITNFTFYDTFGELLTSMSSSSQTEEGEAISELAMDPEGETIVVYNPKIKRTGKLGSQAQVKLANNEFRNIYRNTDRYLKELKVSDDGNMITAITAQDGTDDQVLIMDRYGNELNSITTDENLSGVSLSADNKYITLYSSGRAIVYSVNGDRIGASSSRSPVFLADYFPEDNVLLFVMGNYSENSGILNNVEFRAVNIQQRQIASEDFPGGALGFTDEIQPRLVRTSAGEYQLKGSSKEVIIRAGF